jgi:cob(I)alamin adenosyltransferase
MKPNIGSGDKGQTSMLYGERVSKNSFGPEALGVVDELNSTLGLAKALCVRQYSREVIDSIQKDLGIVATELATEPARQDELAGHGWTVTDEMSNGGRCRHRHGPGCRAACREASHWPDGSERTS